MKKIVFMVIVALSTLATSTLNAQTTDEKNGKEVKSGRYNEVELSDLTQNIAEAIYSTYPNCRIDDVFVSPIAYAKYKVVLLTQDRKQLMVYMDDKGVVLNEHKTFLVSRAD